MLKFEKVNLEKISSQFNGFVNDGDDIKERIMQLHTAHGLLIFDHLHWIYHSIKADIEKGTNLGDLKTYILFKLNTLDKYFRESHPLFGGDHFLPVRIDSLSKYNEEIAEKDRYTHEHSIRVSLSSLKIGERLDLKEDEMLILEISSLLHDVGKIKVPDSILNKTGSYSPEEYQIMMHHPLYGAEILKKNLQIEGVEDVVRAHHEKLDGSGYPYGLTDRNIPKLAKIIMVADSFDAMINNRVYRPALSEFKAKEQLIKHAGTQFDEKIVEIFLP